MGDHRDLTIRAVAAADADAVADVFLAARAEMTYLPARHTEAETRAWIGDVVIGEQTVLVALNRKRTVGFGALTNGTITNLYVRPQDQHCGVGAALLATLKQRAARPLKLWVFEVNRDAIRFYQRHGFFTAERTDGRGNEENLPDRLMTWTPPA